MLKIDLSQIKLWKVFASLGIPGLALGVFYFLFQKFDFQFSAVPAGGMVLIVILFMVLTSGIVFYALMRWAPTAPSMTCVRVTVLGPNEMPVDGSRVWSSIGGEPKAVDGGWELEFAASKLPGNRKITIYAEQKQANLSGQCDITVQKGKPTVSKIQLKQLPEVLSGAPKKKNIRISTPKI